MKPHRPLAIILTVILVLLLAPGAVDAATVQIPEWFSLSVGMAAPPEPGKPVAVNVRLNMLTGDIANAEVRPILPETWKSEPEKLSCGPVKEGGSAEVIFNVTPGSCLNQGSIVIEAIIPVPKAQIIGRIKKDFPESAEGMIAAVNAWPDETKRYSDLAFALFAEESFFPLTGDMWLAYDDSLAPEKGFRGPVYYEDTLISP
ncbi:MAG: hypothetical protein PHD82_08425, partial [Candidatus Riflebacteria bacterium]|nr:hypothetical protein [Candidatus Riflebacteria bacterium]